MTMPDVLETRLMPNPEEKTPAAEISADDLSLLLGGIDLRSVQRRKRFQSPGKPR